MDRQELLAGVICGQAREEEGGPGAVVVTVMVMDDS
jgi:hypothetical protein